MKTVSGFDALIIGSGCAGYNAADSLFDNGVKNIAIVSESRMAGTSRNTGSDKQTYYKVSMSGNDGDGAFLMAKTLFDGGSMDGDVAMCEAAGSIASFMKLERLGVKFPRNSYGEFVGYKTDHDPFARASSVGPYTSKQMTEALEKSVAAKGIMFFDGYLCVSAVVDRGAVCGVVAINCNDLSDDYGLTFFESPRVIVATGGPSVIYRNSVYPLSHTGFSSLPLRAGAFGANLSEWQYGLASVDFRWNVSGTYQQVLPRYISVDASGTEREFLLDYYSDPFEALNAEFLKGYEWPFDCKKTAGSSKIDLIVHNETVRLGRKVYMDFTREPSCLIGGDFSRLSDAARNYLGNSDALVSSPLRRLEIMNAGAISLYKDHGIDLYREPLRIAVCAQHNNGGIDVSANWETNIRGLYVAGEAACTLGVVRPGGTALNSCQVGGSRIADAIAYGDTCVCGANAAEKAAEEARFIRNMISSSFGKTSTVIGYRKKLQTLMSEDFAFLRETERMKRGCEIIRNSYGSFGTLNRICAKEEIPELIKNYDMTVSQLCYAESMLYSAETLGSRGGALVKRGETELAENTEYRSKKIQTLFDNGKVKFFERKVRPLPTERDLWFEKVWKEYREKVRS